MLPTVLSLWCLTTQTLPYLVLICRWTQSHDKGKKKATVDPEDWTALDVKGWSIQDVVSWLESKGLDQDVRTKFTGTRVLQLVLLHVDYMHEQNTRWQGMFFSIFRKTTWSRWASRRLGNDCE